jgi:hypothetical protein
MEWNPNLYSPSCVSQYLHIVQGTVHESFISAAAFTSPGTSVNYIQFISIYTRNRCGLTAPLFKEGAAWTSEIPQADYQGRAQSQFICEYYRM